MLFAVGGFALAAGVLSFARMTPESMTGGGGTPETEPAATATDTDTAGDAVTTVEAVPPSAHPGTAAGNATGSAVMGGESLAPTPGASANPTSLPTAPAVIPAARGDAPVTTAPDTTGIPTAAITTPPPPAPTSAPTTTAPRHTPSPTAPAPAPSHQPPNVCVPIVGICVNGLLSPGHQ